MLEKALALARLGLYVFPVRHTSDNEKIPLTPNGLSDSSTEEYVIREWWSEHPGAQVGVVAEPSGLVILDIDVKNGKDGWESIGFLEVPETFWYETLTGGAHYVYAAPEGVPLSRATDYRHMVGVDRQGGRSFAMWVGDVPASRDEFTPAPGWLCDPVKVKSSEVFEGTVKEWFEVLVPGEPNALVRRAIDSVSNDMSHGEMVGAQHHAVRLGAEGNPGVPELLSALEEAWLARNPQNHTTPESAWQYKFAEALAGGVEKFGDPIAILKNVQPFEPSMIPARASSSHYVGEGEANKADWTRALERLIDCGCDDATTLSILWGAPKTKPLSRDWGIEFVNRRIKESRDRRESPDLEIAPIVEPETTTVTGPLQLLDDQEKDRIKGLYTFEQMYLALARVDDGFVNEILFRAGSWNVLSLALGFHGFIPASQTSRPRFNLWITSLAESGTGKTTALKFEDTVLGMLFKHDSDEQPFKLSDKMSPQGVHRALLLRDKKASFLSSDESSGFFKSLNNDKFMSTASDELSQFYDGYVPAATKISAAELKGKDAVTSFNIHFRSTPDRFLEQVTSEQFISGFLARMNWVIAPTIEFAPDSLTLTETDTFREGVEMDPPALQEFVVFLKMLQHIYPPTLPVHSTPEALARMEQCLNAMNNHVHGHPQQEVLAPAVRRLGYETMRKLASLVALYRGSKRVDEVDVLVSIQQIQEWFDNLIWISSKISESIFSQQCNDILEYVMTRPGRVASEADIYRRFRSTVRAPREIEDRLTMLRVMGSVVLETPRGKGARYRANA